MANESKRKFKTPQRFWRVRNLSLIRAGVQAAKHDDVLVAAGIGPIWFIEFLTRGHEFMPKDALLWLQGYGWAAFKDRY